MTPEEIREYNKIVIDVSEHIATPWKWSTAILALLLAGMLCLYFFNPVSFDVDQTNNNTSNSNNIMR